MKRANRCIELALIVVLTFMLLIFKYLKNLLRSSFPSFPDLIGESREVLGLGACPVLDTGVKPDNVNHWNRVRYG